MENKMETYRVASGYDGIDRRQWSDFVGQHPDGTVFQTPEYYEIHLNAKGFRPHVIAVCDSKNNIAGVMVAIINRVYGGALAYFTSRAVIAGGPLVKDNDEEIACLLLETFRTDKRVKVIYSQFRNLFDITGLHSAFEAMNAVHEDHLNILIDLTQSEEELWKGVKSRKRTYINQAKKKGITVKRLLSQSDVKAAYLIIAGLYKRAKLPLADYSLFSNAFRMMNPLSVFRMYGVILEEKLIGVMFVFAYKGRFYDWYAASLQEYYSLNPNDILPWEIFLEAQREGARLFDFGGAGKPGVPYGVRDYKIQFGGQLVNFGRYELAHNRFLFAAMRLAFKVWQKIRK